VTQSAWKSPSHETLLPCQTKISAVHVEVPDKISTPTERVQPQTNQLQIKPAEFCRQVMLYSDGKKAVGCNVVKMLFSHMCKPQTNSKNSFMQYLP
jgi:hypothetical protein